MTPEQLGELNAEVQRLDRQASGSVNIDIPWCNKSGMGVDIEISYTWDRFAGDDDE